MPLHIEYREESQNGSADIQAAGGTSRFRFGGKPYVVQYGGDNKPDVTISVNGRVTKKTKIMPNGLVNIIQHTPAVAASKKMPEGLSVLQRYLILSR